MELNYSMAVSSSEWKFTEILQEKSLELGTLNTW